MGFLKWLFGKKHKEENIIDEEPVYARSSVNFHDEEERKLYIGLCLEQKKDAEEEIELLMGEYGLVTTYLTDMEEVDALPGEHKSEIRTYASKMQVLEREIKEYLSSRSRMTDNEYNLISSQENEVAEGIKKLKEAENYQGMVKHDMRKLDAERHSYQYRQTELREMLENFRGMVGIVMIATVFCVAMLLVMQFVFEMKTLIAYFIVIPVVVLLLLFFFWRYTDAEKELGRVERANRRLVQLQNRVKIHYVNNTNLLQYLYLKYNVDNAGKLEDLWNKYQDEKEKRRQFAETEAKLEYHRNKLLAILVRFRVKYPERLLRMPEILLDPKEMVESRHELIVRRQALRKQLDYNRNLLDTAEAEMRDVVLEYPEYEAEILAMISEKQKVDL